MKCSHEMVACLQGRIIRLLAMAWMFAILTTGCSTAKDTTSSSKAPGGQSLLPVFLPDLSRVDEAVQAQARERYGSLTQKIGNRATTPDELGAAYGQLGMLLQAGEYFDAAEPCYLNAQALMPTEMRWPYYLGHLYKSTGRPDKAGASFERVLLLRPNDLPTLIWLGRLYLDQGRPEAAAPLFTKALSLPPRSVAVLAGLGQAALAEQDYGRATKYLEEALSVDPGAVSLHSPLAIAYRGLGQLDQAEAHLKQWRNRDILVPDPLRQELDLLLQSGLSYELRGVRALEGGDWKAAAAFFRKGVELTPNNTQLGRSLRHKLGTAVFLSGDVRGAVEHFDEVVRQSPPSGQDESSAKAHYSLGIVMASSDRGEKAIEHFSAAVKYQPNYVEAHLALADGLRRHGRLRESLPAYQQAIKINPRNAQARMGYAFALIRLRRYREARDWLMEAVRLQPDRPELTHALARLLAAAPDDAVRDGERALELVQELFKTDKSTDLGETMAMSLAELGEYDKATAIQRGVMAAAEQAGLKPAVQRMAENLRLYEHRQASRTPWRDDDPVHAPGPPVGPDLLSLSKRP